MKFNIKLTPDGEDEQGEGREVDTGNGEEVPDEAMPKFGKLRLPGAQGGQLGVDTNPRDLDAFMEEAFTDDEGEEEDPDAVEEGEWEESEYSLEDTYGVEAESSGALDWEEYLSEDEDEVAKGEPPAITAPPEGKSEGSKSGSAGEVQPSSWANPLLEDDEDEEFFSGAELEHDESGSKGKLSPTGVEASSLESKARVGESKTGGPKKTGELGGGEGASGPEAFFNPLLEDEEDEDVRAPSTILPPSRPGLSPRDAAALEERNAREAAKRSRRKHRGEVGSVDELDGQVGFNRKISYEVSVDDEGREKQARKALRPESKPVEAASGEVKPAPVEVVDGEGKARWTVRKDAGRLSQSQLGVFRNLNRAGGTESAEELVREVFQRATGEDLDDAALKRRKKLANRAIYGVEAVTSNSRKRFTEKDRDVLRFLGMFKYANAKHASRILQVKEATMLKRLYSLGERGLVLKKDLYGAKPLWYLTEAGMICSGLEIPRVKESGITYSMLPHQFVVNHVAGNLWGAGVNVLGLEDFPSRFRRDEAGEWQLGESLVSEYEVQSSFASAKAANHRADVYRPAILDAMNREFRRWSSAGKPPDASPEMLAGNEYMWTLFPPFALRLAYHVPDLVVKRPRTPDGKPQSIAVEVELANKPLAAYERALNAYRFDRQIYGKVIWVVKSRGAARKVQEAAKKIGTWDEGRVGIVPIYTEEGVFKGKAVWTL